MKINTHQKWIWLGLINMVALTSCASTTQTHFTNANIELPHQQKSHEKPIPSMAILTNTQNPDVQKAFAQYQETGKAPIIQNETFVQFPFGKIEPIIVCSPLHTCDIAFENGEAITGLYPGDSSRWMFEEAMSGADDNAHMHLMIKPKDINIATNIVITTSKRTYHLGLLSQLKDYVREVSFYYPDDINEQLKDYTNELNAQTQTKDNMEVATSTNSNFSSLDFNYRISKAWFTGKPVWMPLRAFNDGTHVYIQMPKIIRTTDAPALFILNDGKANLVNYRVQGDYYIVDALFQQAELISGSGNHQICVHLHYVG